MLRPYGSTSLLFQHPLQSRLTGHATCAILSRLVVCTDLTIANEDLVTKNRWLWWLVMALIMLTLLAGLLARQGSALPRLLTKQPSASPPTSPMILTSPPLDQPWPAGEWGALYLVHDWRLGPQNVSDWRQSYPGWQMVGGWVEATWEEVNPSKGEYDFSRLIEYVEASANSAESRPVAIHIMLHGRDENEARRLADWTPAWVYDEIDSRPEVDGRPVGSLLQPEGCDRPAAMPAYDHPLWQLRVDDLVTALGNEFDPPDRYPNLRALSIGWGFEDLDQPTHDVVCAYSAQLDPAFLTTFEGWTDHFIKELSVRFQHRLVWVMTTPDNAARRAGQLDQHAAGNIGLMIVQPAPEAPLPETATLRSLSTSRPIGWRLAEPNALTQTYWGLLDATSQGVGWVDMQWAHLLTAQTIQRETGFDLLSFTRDYAGREPYDTPGAWTLFGSLSDETAGETLGRTANACASGLHPDISRQNRITFTSDDNGTSTRFGDLPLHIGSAWGTDESRGIEQVTFDLDTVREPHSTTQADQLPALLRIIYLDQGADTFDLIYPAGSGQLARRTINKSNTGQWALAEFPIIGPAWNSLDQHDLLIHSNGDGDELLHLVEIRLPAPSAHPGETTAQAAGWELLPVEQSAIGDQHAAKAPETAEPQPHVTSVVMMPVLHIPMLIWFLAAALIGLVILATRLLMFAES